jgi:uncharacterized membrane protein YphA (DoxX/SURF4 family)
MTRSKRGSETFTLCNRARPHSYRHTMSTAQPDRLSHLIGRLHADARFRAFTWFTRAMLALAFLPSGLKKLLGMRFTQLPIESQIGFFFEALYRTGFYWNFIGAAQLAAAALLLIPRTTRIGALVYFPIALNIFLITVSMHFRGTPVITGLMLLGSIWLVLWEFPGLRPLLERPASHPSRA